MQIKPGIYRHFKGDRYLVLGIFVHTETLGKYVAYIGFSGFWIRPLESFLAEVKENSQPRFSFDN